jgi:hypothetical protein
VGEPHVDMREPQKHNAAEIPACHNFEVEHERWIFDMRKPSDDA